MRISPGGTDQALEARIYQKLAQLDTASGDFSNAEKNLEKAESAIDAHPSSASVAIDILLSQADLSRKQNKALQASEYYRQAAERMEKILGPHHPRVEKLIRFADDCFPE